MFRRPRGRGLTALTSAAAVIAACAGGAVMSTGAAAARPHARPRVAVSAADGVNLTTCPWMNTSLSPGQRARLLIQHSSLDQVIRWLDEKAANNPTQTAFGGAPFGTGPTVTYPAQVPCTPQVNYTDAGDYVRGPAGVTLFPTQIATAATWNPSISYRKGQALATEAFETGSNVILGPAVQSDRTPLDGRTPEFESEDPLLSGSIAGAEINGIQHDGDPGDPVMAVLKHYVAYEQEFDRNDLSSNLSGRTLQETYNLPFAITIADSNPGGVMCSYNQINGVYACENPVMNDVLRAEDGFKGYTVSDFGAVHSTAPSLNAGLDQELNAPDYFTPVNVNAAIDDGQITVPEIDHAAFLVVRAHIAKGLFDHPLPAAPATNSSTPAHQALSERIAQQGTVLLKNSPPTAGASPLLPLTAADDKIAVIGATASNTVTGSGAGALSYASVCEETGADATPASQCANPIDPLDAITSRAAQDGASVTWDNGTDPTSAAAAAAAAKVAVVFAYTIEGEGADPTSLELPGNQDAVIAAVEAANPNTVVVLQTGSAVTMPWVSTTPALLESWYAGQQGGAAIASLLYGDANFSGRLPITFPVSMSQLPEQTAAQYPGLVDGSPTRPAGNTDVRQVDFSEGLATGYKWYQSQHLTPLFAFGAGLSYTSFADHDLRVTRQGGGDTQQITVSFDVTNTGQRAGVDTPQVYLALPSSTGEPGTRLVGFSQIDLKAGQTKVVRYTVSAGSPQHPLSYWSTTSHSWQIAPGTYTVDVNTDAETTLLSSQFSE